MSRRRKEERQIGWLERGPVYTFFVLAFVLPLTVFIASRNVISDLAQRTALQKYNWNRYLGSKLLAPVWSDHQFRMLCVVDQLGKTRWAIDADIGPGYTENFDGEILPFALSDWSRKQGSTQLVLELPQPYDLERFHRELRKYVYGGEDVWDWFCPGLTAALWRGLAGMIAGLVVVIPADYKRLRGLRYGRWVSGSELISAKRFNRRQRGQGIGFVTQENWLDRLLNRTDKQVRIPKSSESQGFLLLGDRGRGMWSIVRYLLADIAKRGEVAIVYDPAGEYLPQFFAPNRGDIVLNPLDARCPYWSPTDEFRHFAEAVAIAKSMFPSRPGEPPFLGELKGKIFAHLLRFRPTLQELAWWMGCPEEIDRRVRGSEVERLIKESGRQQRESILASFAFLGDSFRLLPNRRGAHARWTAAEWAKQRGGWIFLTLSPSYREQMRPLTSLWFDLLILRCLEHGKRDGLPAWFFLDELDSLHPLSQLPTALSEKRNSDRFVLGVQNKLQVEASYCSQGEAMLSQLATKIFLRSSDPPTAKWGSEMLGEIEVEKLEKMEKTNAYGWQFAKSYRLTSHRRPLVSPSDIEGMPENIGYLKYDNDVVRLSFPPIELPELHEHFIPRRFLPEPKQLTLVLESNVLDAPSNRGELILQPRQNALQPKLLPQSAPESTETKPRRFLY